MNPARRVPRLQPWVNAESPDGLRAKQILKSATGLPVEIYVGGPVPLYRFKNQLTKLTQFSYYISMFFQLFGSKSELNMSPQEVKAKLDQGGKIVLVDVREPWEIAINRLDGAVHIPLADLGRRYNELDPQAEIISYCHMGVRSLKATQFLKQQGFEKARNLEGGIDAWSLKVDTTVPRYR